MVKGVIFDLDGTLFDSMWVWREVDTQFVKNHGLPVEEDYLETLKSMNFTECAKYTRKRYSLDLTDAEMMAEWDSLAKKAYAQEVELKAGVKEYLTFLKEKGAKIAVATSCYLSLCMPTLRRHGIADVFDGMITKDDDPKSKEHPDIYLSAAEKIGLSPGECAVFEDILTAVKTAKGAGFTTIGVADSASLNQKEEISSVADCYINDFFDRRIYNIILR